MAAPIAPSVTELPDVVGCLIERLLASPAVVELASSRVSGELQPDWGMSVKPKYAIVVDGPLGGSGEIGPGVYEDRFDVLTYGPNPLRQKQLMRRVRPYLVPVGHGQPIANGFHAAHTSVLGIVEESAPFSITDPDTHWSVGRLPIRVRYSGVPLP